jgi:hypothetical protein
MHTNFDHNHQLETLSKAPALEVSLWLTKLRNSIWLVGVPSWLFGITDRSIAAFADGYVTAIEITHLFMASFFFLSWLCLKPEEDWDADALKHYRSDAIACQREVQLSSLPARMRELQKYHLIRQEYLLPIPYLCQIFHLLNLKHLESIHSFSLGNLKIVRVSHTQPTEIGGTVKFQTVLDSQTNVLRIWRQPVVEVDLTLHTPYTVELSIPVYGDKRITVIFNAVPLNKNEHYFLIDIYSNLSWYRPLLQLLLHIASCLTLFEDLPYLYKLADRNLYRLIQKGHVSNHETMWLFRRYVELYGSRVVSSELPIEDQHIPLLLEEAVMI